ncbi:MAG: ankyrin repeat domain-containing protein, partial [Pyramidobacter sp.]|nr:ankyrin repeat domain-containing protein [Pyramidobacter sp.]
MNEKKRFYVYWSIVFAAAMLCVFLLSPQSHAETAAKNEAASGSLIDAIRSSIPETLKEEAREAKDEKERAEALKKAQNDLPRLDALLAALYKCELLPDAAKNMIRDAVSKVRSLQQNLWEQNQSIIHYLYAMGNVLGEMLGATIEGEANVTIAALSEDPAAQKLFFELLLEYEERPAAFGPEPQPEEDRAGVLKRAEEQLEMFDMLLNALYESDQLEQPLKAAIHLGVSKIRGSSLNLWDQNDLVISLLINMGEILRKRSNAEENVLYAALAKVPASQMLMRTLEKSYSKRPEVLGPKPDFDFDAEPEDGEGGDDFHALCRTGSADKVKAAIAAGADVNAKNNEGFTPLVMAVSDNGAPEVVKALIDAGANVNANDNEGDTPLTAAAACSKQPQVVEILIAAGANVNAKNLSGETPLWYAAFTNPEPEIVKTLVAAGANVNEKDEKSRTPLTVAVLKYPNPEVVKTLIAAGADVNAKDHKGITPLMVAVLVRSDAAVPNMLLDAGADISVAAEGATALDA